MKKYEFLNFSIIFFTTLICFYVFSHRDEIYNGMLGKNSQTSSEILQTSSENKEDSESNNIVLEEVVLSSTNNTSSNTSSKEELKPVKFKNPQKIKYKISEKEKDMMAYVIQKELRSSSLEHKIIICQLMINRLNSDRFPNNISDVLHSPRQFGSISNYYNKKLLPDKDTLKAVELATSSQCEDMSKGALFYHSVRYDKDPDVIKWFKGLEFCFEVTEVFGDRIYTHEFYK